MEERNNNSMNLIDHLQELRKRILWVIIFFIASLVIGFLFAEPVIDYFKNSLAAESIDWNVFRLTDAIMIYLKFAFLIGMALTMPFALFQAWRFVAPGLTKKEQNLTIWFIPSAFMLFIAGISFAYFITFPMIVNFLANFSLRLEVQQTYGISEYFTLMFNMIIPFGLFFELPIIVVFLTRIGILNPELLIRFRKIAYLILVILAASITPPDLVSEIIVAIPLLLLYEFSIWLSKITAKRRKKSLEQSTEDNSDAEKDE